MTRSLSRILVPTDFSFTAKTALEYATTIATRFGATVHIVHVSEMRAELIDGAAATLALLVSETESRRLKVTSEVRIGPVAATICELAEEGRFDLIVMGAHGPGLGRLLLGKVAEMVIRNAPCPVLTVRGEASGYAAIDFALAANEYVAWGGLS